MLRFWSKKGMHPTKIRGFNFTTVDYTVYWALKSTLSSIGFEWKKSVDFLVSGFFLHCDLLVRHFPSNGTGFGFPPV